MPPPNPPKILIPTPLPHPLPPPLLSTLLSSLLTTSALPPILATLNTQCQEAGWQDAVQKRITQMLKEEGYVDKAEVMRVLVREARGSEMEEEEEEEGEEGDEGDEGGEEKRGRKEGKIDVRVPEKAVQEGVKVVRGYLEKVVEIEPELVDFWSS